MTTVLALGVFDLLHIGHLRYLEYARLQGDCLWVGVLADQASLFAKNKQPVIRESERLEIVGALRCVDRALLMPVSTEQTKPAADWIIALGEVKLAVIGGNWRSSERWQRLGPILERSGINVSFAPSTPGISTSELVVRIRERPDTIAR